jgi:hypothetical protein
MCGRVITMKERTTTGGNGMSTKLDGPPVEDGGEYGEWGPEDGPPIEEGGEYGDRFYGEG